VLPSQRSQGRIRNAGKIKKRETFYFTLENIRPPLNRCPLKRGGKLRKRETPRIKGKLISPLRNGGKKSFESSWVKKKVIGG